MSDRIWRSRFFSCFSCQLSISNKELSNDLSYAGHPTGCMIELTAGGLDSGGAAAALLANILCHQSWEHRTRGPQVAWRARDRHCYQNCVRNTTLWPALALLALCIQLITHFTPQLTILGQCWETCEDGKIEKNLSPLSPAASAMIISGGWPAGAGGGEKCNKILLKNNIYSDQGPVPDVGITPPRGGPGAPAANIFSFKWSKTLLFVLILIWQFL